jgi:DNA-binding LacI/PurR family transcriptional regulator
LTLPPNYMYTTSSVYNLKGQFMAMNVREVARQLDLSPATISKAMRGQGGEVSIETARKVLAHCQQGGYITKAEATRIMMKMRTAKSRKQIFVLSCYRGVEVYDATFAGICERLQDNSLYSSFYVANEPSSMAHFPYDQAGIVIVLGHVHKDAIEQFILKKIAVVLVDNRIANIPISAVNSDNLEGDLESTQMLINLGHKRIAFMCLHEEKDVPTYTFLQRQSGYMAALTNNGIQIDPSLMIIGYGDIIRTQRYELEQVISDIKTLAEKTLAINPLPTAIVTGNDLAAYVLRDACKQKGIRVPQDISIVGYDGLHRLSNRPTGFEPVSTRVVKWQEIGIAAVDLALELFSGENVQHKCMQIPTVYEDAGTVAKPRKD